MSGRVGWAWGSRIPATSAWLTIAGSHHARPQLTESPDAAVKVLDCDDTLALVEHEGGTVFRIIQLAEEAQ